MDIFQLFAKSDPRYLLNQLYIQDYCTWIQKSNEETLKSLASGLESVMPYQILLFIFTSICKYYHQSSILSQFSLIL